MLRPPTLETVAARAGVSRATASRVLRGDPRVGADAATAVRRAATDLGYVTNQAARSLVTRRSGAVAFVVAEPEGRLFADPYFPVMLRAAQSVTAAADLQLVFAVASTPTERANFERFASGGHVDGVLLASLHGDDDLPTRLAARGVPLVVAGRAPATVTPVSTVDADNVAGGRLAAQHLVATGRTRIATVAGPQDMSPGRDRLAGFRAAMADARLAPVAVVEGDFTVEGGYAAARRLLAGVPDLDAVVAASDLTAFGVLRALAESGRRVPDDVAVVGFDDVREAALATPPLTTVRQPIAELGATMARLLVDHLAGRTVPGATVLPVDLVRRASA